MRTSCGASRRTEYRASATVRGVKIADLRATPVNIPLRAPYRFAYGSIASLTKTVIEVVTDEGVVGLGEIAGGDCAAAALAFRDRLVGLDILDLNAAEAPLRADARATRRGTTRWAHRRVFGGIEMALWDARGQAEGRSLATLLGGAVRTHVGAHRVLLAAARRGRRSRASRRPLEVARYCARMIDEHDADGVRGQGRRPSRSTRRWRWCARCAPRSAPTASCASTRTAAGRCRPRATRSAGSTAYDVRYYEDPVETHEEMAALRPATRASFSSHLTDLREGRRARRAGHDRLEPERVRRHPPHASSSSAPASAFDVGFRFHSGETGIGSAAYLQLSAAIGHVREPSQTLLRWYADDVIAEGPFVAARRRWSPSRPAPGSASRSIRWRCARCHERYRTEGPFPGGPSATGTGRASGARRIGGVIDPGADIGHVPWPARRRPERRRRHRRGARRRRHRGLLRRSRRRRQPRPGRRLRAARDPVRAHARRDGGGDRSRRLRRADRPAGARALHPRPGARGGA